MAVAIKTSILGVYENLPGLSPCVPGSGPATSTFFHVASFGPAVTFVTPSIAAGTPPPGLTPFVCPGTSSALYMRGVPTALGVYTYQIDVLMSNGSVTSWDCQQTIALAGPPSGPGGAGCSFITLAPPSPLDAIFLTEPISIQFTATGGTAPYTWDVAEGSALPAGLALSSGGLLTGTPTIVGSYTFAIRALDANGCRGITAYALAVVAPDPIVVNPGGTLDPGARGSLYDGTITAEHGIGGPYVFTVTAGALPPGVSLSSDGTLAGLPIYAGSFTFTIRATDAGANFGERAYTLQITGIRIVIDGEDLTLDISEADVDLALNRQSTAHLTMADAPIPARGLEVLIYARDGITPFFGGLIHVRHVHGIAASHPANAAGIDCVDFSIFFDDASVTLAHAAPVDLEDVIAEIVTLALDDYGITYTPTATGIVVDPFEWVDVIVSDAFKRLYDTYGVVVRVLPLKDLKVFRPLDEAAPVSITDATINAFDITWDDPPNLTPNTVDLTCGPTGNGLATQRWTVHTGDTSWEVDIQAVLGGGTQGYVTEDVGGVVNNRTISTPAAGDGYYFWDSAAGRGAISPGLGPFPGDGATLEFKYLAVFPFHARVWTGTPPRTYREAHPEITEYAAGLATANQILARVGVALRQLEITTDVDGFLPGQELAIDTTRRGGITGSFLVASVSAKIVNDGIWEYTIPVQESEEYQGSYVEQWKALTSSGGSTAAAGELVSVGSVGAGDISSSGAVPFAADQSMGGHKLRNLANPSSGQDAATKASADAADATTLASAEAYTDALAAVVTAAHYIKRDGSVAFTADQSMGAHKLTNVTDPTSAQDAATKAYVDAAGGGGGGSSTSTGTAASRPAAGTAGNLYFPTDGFTIARDSGSAWDPFGPIKRFTTPDDTGFSWRNQGTSTITVDKDRIYLKGGAAGNVANIVARVKTTPATPYTITAYLQPIPITKAYNGYGLLLRQNGAGTGTGRIVAFWWAHANFAGTIQPTIRVEKWTNETTSSASYRELLCQQMPSWFRIVDNGTNLGFWISPDGEEWIELHNVSRTDFMLQGPDQIGFMAFTMNNATPNLDVPINLLSWKQT